MLRPAKRSTESEVETESEGTRDVGEGETGIEDEVACGWDDVVVEGVEVAAMSAALVTQGEALVLAEGVADVDPEGPGSDGDLVPKAN